MSPSCPLRTQTAGKHIMEKFQVFLHNQYRSGIGILTMAQD